MNLLILIGALIVGPLCHNNMQVFASNAKYFTLIQPRVLPDQLLVLNKDCKLSCLMIFIWRCNRIPTLEEYCARDDSHDRFGCCRRFKTTTTMLTTLATSATSPPIQTSTTTQNIVVTTTSTLKPETTTEAMTTSTTSTEPPTIIDPDVTICSSELAADWKSSAAESSNQDCEQFRNRPCDCRIHLEGRCNYNVVTGACTLRPKQCDSTFFSKDECRRLNTFYVNAGDICKNEFQFGSNCQIQETPLAVNINGLSYIDQQGILYQKESETDYSDPFKIRVNFNYTRKFPGYGKHLFGLFANGQPYKNQSTQCLLYSIPVLKAGNYELLLKMYEPYYKFPGKRLFSVMLNHVWLLPELDIFSLVGHNNALSIAFNIKVISSLLGTDWLVVKGQPGIKVDENMQLGFCGGECYRCGKYFGDASYIISAFSINRFE